MLFLDVFLPSKIMKDKLLVGSNAFSNMTSKLIIEKGRCMEMLMEDPDLSRRPCTFQCKRCSRLEEIQEKIIIY